MAENAPSPPLEPSSKLDYHGDCPKPDLLQKKCVTIKVINNLLDFEEQVKVDTRCSKLCCILKEINEGQESLRFDLEHTEFNGYKIIGINNMRGNWDEDLYFWECFDGDMEKIQCISSFDPHNNEIITFNLAILRRSATLDYHKNCSKPDFCQRRRVTIKVINKSIDFEEQVNVDTYCRKLCCILREINKRQKSLRFELEHDGFIGCKIIGINNMPGKWDKDGNFWESFDGDMKYILCVSSYVPHNNEIITFNLAIVSARDESDAHCPKADLEQPKEVIIKVRNELISPPFDEESRISTQCSKLCCMLKEAGFEPLYSKWYPYCMRAIKSMHGTGDQWYWEISASDMNTIFGVSTYEPKAGSVVTFNMKSCTEEHCRSGTFQLYSHCPRRDLDQTKTVTIKAINALENPKFVKQETIHTYCSKLCCILKEAGFEPVYSRNNPHSIVAINSVQNSDSSKTKTYWKCFGGDMKYTLAASQYKPNDGETITLKFFKAENPSPTSDPREPFHNDCPKPDLDHTREVIVRAVNKIKDPVFDEQITVKTQCSKLCCILMEAAQINEAFRYEAIANNKSGYFVIALNKVYGNWYQDGFYWSIFSDSMEHTSVISQYKPMDGETVTFILDKN